ncbi:uncharacterized protein LOC107990976 [Cucumis melo]|uniref:Uncharacterized protein LOC107990976 n=1 Tax=Cucumis melo TaxID=3656 RepID=A0A1S4DXB1_CUCME|nr:uncharacterized protein LOC107990976 [Cucumis melo]
MGKRQTWRFSFPFLRAILDVSGGERFLTADSICWIGCPDFAFVSWSFLLHSVLEDLDHLLGHSALASGIWDAFLQTFGLLYARHRDVRGMIEEFLLNLPCGERGRFLWRACVCAILWVLWDETNRRVFWGVERGTGEIWLVIRYHVSLWDSISKTFCNYPLDMILYSWATFV